MERGTAVLWKLTEEQEAYRDALQGWLTSVADPSQVRAWLDKGDRDTFEQRLVADGLAGVGFAEELGGQGGGMVELALTAELLGRVAAPSSGWLATVLAVPALADRPELAAAALAGAVVTLAVPAELPPDAAPTLEVDANGLVSGAVARVLAADRAAHLVVLVVREGRPELRLVDMTGEGVSVSEHELLDRSRAVADVQLRSAASVLLDVHADEVLAEAAARAAVLVAADSLGAAHRMLDMTVQYSLQRKQFGVPIGSFQAVKHAAATILVGVEAGRSIVYFAAASVQDRADGHLLHAAAAKAQVTQEGVRTADSALTLHGAIGYTWEHDLHLYYKRAKLDEQLFGSPDRWNERIADHLPLL
jgi:alkylation response protein AidB-like acyl-CoA dehydrogenase